MPSLNKIIIKFVPAVIFITICTIGFFYILNSVKSLNIDTASVDEQIQSEISRRNNIEALNEDLKNIAPQREMLNTHFAVDSDVVPFLDNLQALSIKAGSPSEVSSVDLNKDDGHLEVSMKTEGSFTSIYKLLELLENSPFEIDFSSVHLDSIVLSEADKKLGKTGGWSASFDLTLLSFNSKINGN